MRAAVLLLPLLLSLAHPFDLVPFDLLDRVDNLLADARAHRPRTRDERIVIIDVDEASLATVGRWPWPRERVATLLERLFDEQQVRLLGLDVVLAEPDPTGDAVLAGALHGRRVVLGYYFTGQDRGAHAQGQLPAPVLRLADLPEPRPALIRWNGYGANLPVLAAAAPQAGFFNAIPDPDGVVRAMPLLSIHGEGIYESLALALYRRLLGAPPVVLDMADAPALWWGAAGAAAWLQGVRLPLDGRREVRIPMEVHGTVRVPYRGPGGPSGGSFAYVSAADVLEGRLAPGSLRGRIALLGFSAPGLGDLHATPVGPAYPGVEVHANVLSGLLDGRLVVRPDYASGFEVVQLLVLGLVLVLWLPRLGAARAALATALLLAALVTLHHLLQVRHGLVLPQASALFLLVLALGVHLGWGYLVEAQARRRLAQAFGSYVPPEVVRRVLSGPGRDGADPRVATTREMTVMFCDIRGFSALAEALPPAPLQALLSDVLGRLSTVVSRYEGTIDKFIGDGLMAFWGAHAADPGHARQAVRAAQAIVAEMRAINQEHRRRGLPEIGLGVGLSSGLMSVGEVGSDVRRSYTVIGDAVNLGARLQALSSAYGVDIVASERTRALAPEFAWRSLGEVRVKGRTQAVAIYTPEPTAAWPPAA